MAEETINWDKFDKKVDIEALREDVKEAEENGYGDFPDIPEGEYEVKIKNMELGKSKLKEDGKGGDPMLKIQFEILEGEFKGNYIFYNGVMQPDNENAFGIQVHRNNELLRGIWDCEYDDVEYTGSFAEYNELVLDIAEEVMEDNWEYLLEKGKTSKGFDTYEILEVFE